MITLIAYILLRYYFDQDWTGWLLVLPVILDCKIIDCIEDWRKNKRG